MRLFPRVCRPARTVLLAGGLGTAVLFGWVVPVPSIVALRFRAPSTTAFLEARRERLLAEGKDARIDRRPVPLEKVSPNLVTACRTARERGLTRQDVLKLIDEHTDGRSLGVLGMPGVNVLELNLALDQKV